MRKFVKSAQIECAQKEPSRYRFINYRKCARANQLIRRVVVDVPPFDTYVDSLFLLLCDDVVWRGCHQPEEEAEVEEQVCKGIDLFWQQKTRTQVAACCLPSSPPPLSYLSIRTRCSR